MLETVRFGPGACNRLGLQISANALSVKGVGLAPALVSHVEYQAHQIIHIKAYIWK